MKGRKKGGNFMQQQPQYQNQNQYQQPQYQDQQPQYQYQQPQYQQQPQQQNNYGAMIGDTMKNMQPVYDATAMIGIAYAIFTTIIATIICSFLIYFGVLSINIYNPINDENLSKLVSYEQARKTCKTKIDTYSNIFQKLNVPFLSGGGSKKLLNEINNLSKKLNKYK